MRSKENEKEGYIATFSWTKIEIEEKARISIVLDVIIPNLSGKILRLLQKKISFLLDGARKWNALHFVQVNFLSNARAPPSSHVSPPFVQTCPKEDRDVDRGECTRCLSRVVL